MEHFDLVVIGAGPGGYVAALKAAQNGKKVAVVEKKELGGTCLTVGCIPSKTLLRHSEWVETIKTANSWGIETGPVSIDYPKLKKRKDQVVSTLVQGIHHLFENYGITLFKGEAAIGRNLTVSVDNLEIKGKELLLATGSRPFIPPIQGLDHISYETTDTFFDLNAVPEKLVIIGGGVISIELAFAMAPLGGKVTVVEVAEDILLTEDEDARKIIKKRMKKLGIEYHIHAKIHEVAEGKVVLEDRQLEFTKLLIAAGRIPNNELALSMGLKMDAADRFVAVNRHYLTSKNHVYAIGDLTGGYQLAHTASAEGLVAVHHILGQDYPELQQEEIPRCVYTHPEIATFGLSETQAKDRGMKVTVKKMPFQANGKAIAMGTTDGFIKLIRDEKLNEIVGGVIVGEHATELIGEVIGVKHSEGRIDELAHIVYAHPSLSEVIGETANSLLGKAIHEA